MELFSRDLPVREILQKKFETFLSIGERYAKESVLSCSLPCPRHRQPLPTHGGSAVRGAGGHRGRRADAVGRGLGAAAPTGAPHGQPGPWGGPQGANERLFKST